MSGDIVLCCPDCCGPGSLRRDRARGRWTVTIWHRGECAALRSARARRGVDRFITDLVAAAYPLAHYGDGVEGCHLRGPVRR